MNKNDIAKLTPEEKAALIEAGKIFCLTTLLTGIIKKLVNAFFCKATLVFGITTTIMIIKDLFPSNVHFTGYIIMACIFIFYESIVFLLKNKTNLNLNGNFGLTKNINKTGGV